MKAIKCLAVALLLLLGVPAHAQGLIGYFTSSGSSGTGTPPSEFSAASLGLFVNGDAANCLTCSPDLLTGSNESVFTYTQENTPTFARLAGALTNGVNDTLFVGVYRYALDGTRIAYGGGGNPESVYFGAPWGADVAITSARLVIFFLDTETPPSGDINSRLSYSARYEFYGSGAPELPPLPPVPEPSTYALMLAGLVAVGYMAWRNGSRAKPDPR